jgi:hypothetical protein
VNCDIMFIIFRCDRLMILVIMNLDLIVNNEFGD